MGPAIFSTTAARWTRAIQQIAASPSGPTNSARLQRNLRQVRRRLTQRYHSLHEYARIYHALAAREAKGSERELILLCLAEEADVQCRALGRFHSESSGSRTLFPRKRGFVA